MPRQPRPDAPGNLSHGKGWGIEGIKVFEADPDREDFRYRPRKLCQEGSPAVYACIERGRLFWQLVVGKVGYPGSKAARFLGGTASVVTRAAFSEGRPELQKDL
jgi:hypothetical protein